jgi:hypothetical protein
MPHPVPPAALIEELRHLTAKELSLPSRLRYVVLLLTASTMSAIVTALLLTEPALPLRTTIALAAVAIAGVSWIVFAAWVLTRKRVLLGRHRVVAGRLAITFSSVFTIGALGVGYATSSSAPLAAAAMGLVMVCVAAGLMVRAQHRVAELSMRRDELEQMIRGRNR